MSTSSGLIIDARRARKLRELFVDPRYVVLLREFGAWFRPSIELPSSPTWRGSRR